LGGKKKASVYVHRLQAYQKFGDVIFRPGMETRHLNNDNSDNSYDNISIGSRSDNFWDRPRDMVIRSAAKAASHTRKYSDDEVAAIRSDREDGMTYKQIQEKYGIPHGSLAYLLNDSHYLLAGSSTVEQVCLST
jgi:hypothetical protein